MENLTEKDLVGLLNAFVESDDTDKYYFSTESVFQELQHGYVVEVPDLGTLEHVDSYGGEGQGDEYWVVFKVTSTGQLFKVDGYYSSYDGGSLDGDVYEVTPVQVTVTQYKKKAK